MSYRSLRDWRVFYFVLILSQWAPVGFAGPVIDPIANVTIPAGKSLIIPVTATSTNGRPLAFTASSSTNGIAVVMHTNNPFWKMTVVQAAPTNTPGAFLTPFRGGLVTVTNVGDLTFMLFPCYASAYGGCFHGADRVGILLGQQQHDLPSCDCGIHDSGWRPADQRHGRPGVSL